jgi:6-pyruvoyl-tetrahydropterin synthase
VAKSHTHAANLEIALEGEMLVLNPLVALHDLDELELEGAVNELLERMDHSLVTDVLVDLHRTDVLHSHAPRLAVELWKRVRSHGGSVAIGLI